MANEKRLKHIAGYNPDLSHFLKGAGELDGDFTFSVVLNDGRYRTLHGLDTEDVKNTIRAQSGHLTILNIYAVFH